MSEERTVFLFDDGKKYNLLDTHEQVKKCLKCNAKECTDCVTRKKVQKGGRMSENQEQIALIKWCYDMERFGGLPELRLIFHVPNERKCTPAHGYFLQRMGVKKGVPDLFLPVPRGGKHGLFIEMKAEKGRLTPEQKVWMETLREQGYAAEVCYGAKVAIGVILNYLGGEKKEDKGNGSI